MFAEIVAPKDLRYNEFKVKKQNGKYRKITAPNALLKETQSKILMAMESVSPHDCSHGFVKNRNIVTNAMPHVGKGFVLNCDIKNFFPSVKSYQVSAMFKAFYGVDNTDDLLKICMFKGGLPQGSPCSPYIANMVLYSLDEKINSYCKERGLSYTRYADDITISGEKYCISILKFVEAVVRSEGFFIAPEKTCVLYRGQQQRVTGLIVNKKVNISRHLRRKIRAMKHQYDKLSDADKDYLNGMNGLMNIL